MLRPSVSPLSVIRTIRLGVRSFHTSSRPALRAAACGGRPRAGNDTTATGEPASPSTPRIAQLRRIRYCPTKESAHGIPPMRRSMVAPRAQCIDYPQRTRK